MSEDFPIGPIVGAAVGLGILAATVKITKDALDNKEREQPRRKVLGYPPKENTIGTSQSEGFDIDSKINRMLGR